MKISMTRLIDRVSRKEKFFFCLYFLALVGFFLYSYTQIDLSLTFSRITFLRKIVTSFQYIGYFQRPISLYLYLALLAVFYGFYIFLLLQTRRKKLDRGKIWFLIVVSTVVLAFAYNAFSYDIFNYIFDAKIITHYHQNPYIHKALDYTGDPMLSFMRWTHRVYPYGPLWLVLTVPLSFLGMNLFIPTFLLFKFLMAGSFLGSVYFVGKILRKISPEKEVWGLVFFGLNPLVLVECLISGHLDIVMLFFVLWSFYLLMNKRYVLSLFLFVVSVCIKFATGFLFPVYLFLWYLKVRNKKISWRYLFLFATFFMILTVIAASSRTNFQPWYLLEVIVFAVFISDSFFIFFPVILISLFALFTYAPYLYLGNWDPPVPFLLSAFYLSSYILSLLGVVVYFAILLMQKKISLQTILHRK